MKQWLGQFGVTLALLCHISGSLAADPGKTRVEHLAGGYSVELPESLTIEQASSMPDFSLYKVFDKHGNQLLAIYLGNFPDTAIGRKENSLESKTSINGYSATSTRWINNDGTHNGVTLLELTDSQRWPKYAQLLFNGVSRSRIQVVEPIVSSFRREPDQQSH
jgi:hypothetical protein